MPSPYDTPEKTVVDCFLSSCNARMSGGRSRFDAADPYSFLATNAKVTINGTTPLSGCYEGLELVRRILVDTAATVVETLHIRIDRLVGRGATVAALLEISGTSTRGFELNRQGDLCGAVFEVANDRVTSVTLFPDTSLIETALFGWTFAPNLERPANVSTPR